ncbi:MAG: hypothetical protein QOF49_426 [Chloroflexota bacterium]|jgi:hypothetical protein|nr:hypothetical protein [Chloroflexota bacterium]
MPPTSFPIRVGRRSRLLLRILFGVQPAKARVLLGDGPDGELDVVFGWAHFHTPFANVASWRIEGPFRWITAIGIRRSIRHGDVTFGGSHHGGVRIDFHHAAPWSRFRVPAIYVPVDDLDALAAELTRRGVPGEDRRHRVS